MEKTQRTMIKARKLLIQMSGAPGSGKSTMASLLSKSINGVVINHDLIKSFFLENGSSFSQSANLTYSFDWVLAEDMIKQGWNVIIDSTCNYEEVLDRGTTLARKYNYDYIYVECRVDDIDLLDRRLHERVPLRSQRTGVNLPPQDSGTSNAGDLESRELFKRWIENPCRPVGRQVVIVDSSLPTEDCLEYILGQIGRQTALELGSGGSTERDCS
ncbi:hypothetical protein ABW19_dt0205242 [Dactylella cylindrospora]|nr:hypothetical protein ABW19_dt0205242 [Dactylella cylindrospora]